MPKISKIAERVPESPIRKLAPYADAAKNKGIKVIHLNIGQPDIKTPIEIHAAIKNFEFDILSYLPSEGSLSYREKLAKYYAGKDVSVEAKDIIITTGGSEALVFALFATLDEGDELIVPEPFYANYSSFCTMGSFKIIPVTSQIENNFALPSIEEFEKKITSKTKVILICNPNNPTGYLYTKNELETLKDLCIKHDLFIIVDEVYREFVYDENKKFISILSLEGIAEYAILVDSISKRYSACGARIGAIVCKNKEVMSAVLKFAQGRLSVPTFSELVAEAALETKNDYFENVI